MIKRIYIVVLSFLMIFANFNILVKAEGEEELQPEEIIEEEPTPEEDFQAEQIVEEEPKPEEETQLEEMIIEETLIEEEAVALDNVPDSDVLLQQYIDKLAFGNTPEAAKPMLRKAPRQNNLSGAELNIYNLLKEWIEKVASGKETLTQITFTYENVFTDKTYTAQELGVDNIVVDGKITKEAKAAIISKYKVNNDVLMKTLLFDMPYTLFWFDKKTGMSAEKTETVSAKYNNGTWEGFCKSDSKLKFYFAVSTDFIPTGYSTHVFDGKTAPISTDQAKIKSVASAVKFAKEIVSEASDLDDYGKLEYYKNQICNLVSYNSAAADNDSTPYGNPWQLIYVFDKNSGTNVVCEGYAKAFMFLCDLTKFEDPTIECHIVTGEMSGGKGAGGHMWNIVVIDGKNYLVDVTNCDAGTEGYPDLLFLRGNELGNASGYKFTNPALSYVYDNDTLTSYSDSERKLNTEDYEPFININDENTEIRNLIDKDYIGSSIEQNPVVEVTYKGNKIELAKDKDYKLSYENNVSAGTATIIVEGMGKYNGRTTATFKINPININNASISNYEDKEEYTGNPITKNISVNISLNGSNVKLEENKDYTVSYKNNTEVGLATITVVGKGNYTGSTSVNFEIYKDETKTYISNAEVTFTKGTTYTYTGSGIKPTLKLSYDGATLVEGTDYTLSYKNNTNVGTATITITGKGNYSGTVSKTFKINPAKVNIPTAKTGLTYNGNSQIGVATGRNYTLKNNSGTDAKTYTAVATLKDKTNYTWSDGKTEDKNISWKISPASISKAEVTGITPKTYTGKPITQTSTVKVNNVTLKSGTDYTLSYKNNTKVGTATITITGKGNYSGSINKSFNITALSLSNATVSGISTKTYTGSAIIQNPILKVGDITLKNETDYTLNYKNNTNIGTATVTFTGKGNYTGTISKTFNIAGISLSNATVTGISNKTYTGKQITQSPKVVVNNVTLKNGTDYTLSYKNNTKVGTATVTIIGKDNYSGTISKTFSIGALSLSKATISGIVTKTYTGKSITQTPTVKVNNVTLKSGTDYTLSYKNNINVGTATITITGKGNYSGTASKTFKINAITLSGATITGISDKNYTGKAITQSPTVKVNNVTLKSGTDYTLSYKNNTNVGTATVTITGKGNYSGTVNKTFKIKAVTKITLNKSTATLGAKKVGKYTNTLQLKATVTGNSNTKVTWTSSNTKVAKVDSNGKVTALLDLGIEDPSVVTITAKTADGKTATCKITVEDPVSAFVRRLYKYCFNRKADKGGFNYWAKDLRGKKITAAEAVQGFFESNEMNNLKTNNSEFLERCYLVLMDRPSDKGGKNWWLNNMANGMTRREVLQGFVDSNEFKQICKDFDINRGAIKMID